MKNTHALIYVIGITLGLSFSGASQARLDPTLNKHKNAFLKAVEDQRWDDARGSFALISGNLEELLTASPVLSSDLQNKVKEAVEAEDLDAAKILMEWVAQLPQKRINIIDTSSKLQNKVRDAVKAGELDDAKKLMELVALLPENINVEATLRPLKNKVLGAFKANDFEMAKKLMELVVLLPKTINVMNLSSEFQNALRDAVKNNDLDMARKIAALVSYLPKDTNATATIVFLANQLNSSLDKKDTAKAQSLAALGEQLPLDAKQKFFERHMLAELVRRTGKALNDNNWDDIIMLGTLFNTFKRYATSKDGKELLQREKQYLGWAHDKAKKNNETAVAEKIQAIQ